MIYSSKTLLASVALASIATTGFAAEWSLISESRSATLVGVGAASATSGVAAASDNNVGGEADEYNGESWTKVITNTGLNMDAAVSKSGTYVASSMWPVSVSRNGGDFEVAEGVRGISQSVSTVGDNGFALVGSFVPVNATQKVDGVAYSADDGETWSIVDIGSQTYPRYGAFPSEDVWYVSTGVWGNDPAMYSEHRTPETHDLSSRVLATYNGMIFKDKSTRRQRAAGEPTGWFGSVEKTEDGGKTWKTVFSSNPDTDYYYFNGISCSTDLNCAAVAEGYNADGSYGVWTFVTSDGGVNWENTFQDSQLSAMGVKMTSETEGWFATTDYGSGRGDLVANFYRTTDSGATWKLEQTLDNCFALDLDFADGVGYASCSSSSGGSSSVAMYK